MREVSACPIFMGLWKDGPGGYNGSMRKEPFLFCVFLSLSVAAVSARELTVRMLPGEQWWGLCSEFGREMPFTEKSDFRCDLRVSSYWHQSMSLLVSDKGRVLWCAEPVEATVVDGTVAFASDGAEIVFEPSAGRTLAEAFRFASSRYFPSSGEMPEMLYFTAPQLNTWIELTYFQNEKGILEYAESMVTNGLPPGIFIIDDTWQHGYGVWEFDRRRFSDPKGMIDKLHSMGYKVLLWMCPYVSMDTPAYRLLEFGESAETCEKLEKGGFVTLPGSRSAASVDWWNGRSALIDLSHKNGRRWYVGTLDRLVGEYGVDAFKFDGNGVEGYSGYRAHDTSLPAWRQNALYIDLALKYKGSEARGAFGFGGKPLVVRLVDKAHKWSALQKIVPDMIASGMIGCPFVCPDMLGGGLYKSFLPGSGFESELFIRSAQLHALSPMMQISASPWRVLDGRHRKLFKSIVALRQRFVPLIEKLVARSAVTGEPIMRNLEYVFPGRGYGTVKDQFMMGDGLMVAPVVTKGEVSREVELPPGEWIADDGSVYTGPCRIRIDAPLERLAYFMLSEAARDMPGFGDGRRIRRDGVSKRRDDK